MNVGIDRISIWGLRYSPFGASVHELGIHGCSILRLWYPHFGASEHVHESTSHECRHARQLHFGAVVAPLHLGLLSMSATLLGLKKI